MRQLTSRGRRRAREYAVQHPFDPVAHERVSSELLGALRAGDLTRVVGLLAPEVEMVADGGGLVSSAVRPVHGADRVARFLLGLLSKYPGSAVTPALVNGRMGYVVDVPDGSRSVIQVELDAQGRVSHVWSVRNPDKVGSATHSTRPTT